RFAGVCDQTACLSGRHRSADSVAGVNRSYLDHASTSPLRPEARAAWHEAIDALQGDPGRIHEEGMAARVALETAREQMADLVGARGREVVFTSGATESIMAAAHGAVARSVDRNGPHA